MNKKSSIHKQKQIVYSKIIDLSTLFTTFFLYTSQFINTLAVLMVHSAFKGEM